MSVLLYTDAEADLVAYCARWWNVAFCLWQRRRLWVHYCN